MGKRVLDLKEKKEKNKLPVLTVAVISMFLLIAVIAVVTKDMDLGFLKPVSEEKPKESIISEQEKKELVEKTENVVNLIEIMKNQNNALELEEGSEFIYYDIQNGAKVPIQNEFPQYKTCDGRVMPSTINPYASYSWALLAYASAYVQTGDEKYVEEIRKIEAMLYEFNKLTLSPELKVNGEIDYSRVKFGNEWFFPQMNMAGIVLRAYTLLEGKKVLVDEEKFINMYTDNIVYFAGMPNQNFNYGEIIQVESMYADTFSLSMPYILKSGRYTDSQIEQVSIRAKEKLDSSLSLIPSKQSHACWAYNSEYNYEKNINKNSKKESEYFFKKAKSLLESDISYVPVEIQPCAELMLSLYSETGNKLYYEKAVEYYKLLELKSVHETCNPYNGLFVGEVEENPNAFWLSDNSYHLYILNQFGVVYNE